MVAIVVKKQNQNCHFQEIEIETSTLDRYIVDLTHHLLPWLAQGFESANLLEMLVYLRIIRTTHLSPSKKHKKKYTQAPYLVHDSKVNPTN